MEKTSISTSCYKCGQIVRTEGHDIGYALNEHWNNDISCKRESKINELFGVEIEPNCQEFLKKDFNYQDWIKRTYSSVKKNDETQSFNTNLNLTFLD